MKPDEINELIAAAEDGQRVIIRYPNGIQAEATLDDLVLARDVSAYIDEASRLIEQAAADLDLELCPPDAAERAGFAKPPERVTVSGIFEHRPPCTGC